MDDKNGTLCFINAANVVVQSPPSILWHHLTAIHLCIASLITQSNKCVIFSACLSLRDGRLDFQLQHLCGTSLKAWWSKSQNIMILNLENERTRHITCNCLKSPSSFSTAQHHKILVRLHETQAIA